MGLGLTAGVQTLDPVHVLRHWLALWAPPHMDNFAFLLLVFGMPAITAGHRCGAVCQAPRELVLFWNLPLASATSLYGVVLWPWCGAGRPPG